LLSRATSQGQGRHHKSSSNAAPGINRRGVSTLRKTQATRVKGTYTVEGNEVVASGEGNFADERYTLCRASSTNYVFSTDCTAQRFQYIADWLNATDLNSVDQFGKKHKISAYGLDTIIIDRVTPHVDEEKLTNHMRPVYDAKNKKAVVRPFLVSFRYVGDCSVVNPKL
jgi:hypothetical protein